MNYIKELNEFRDWLLTAHLSSGAISLWHALMSINNQSGWKKRFSAPNSIVGQLSGLSRQGILNAREQLIEHGLIRCDKGRRGKAPVYEMISFEKGSEADVRHSVTSLETERDVTCDQVEKTGESAPYLFPKNEGEYCQHRTILDTSIDISVAQDLTVLKRKQKEKRRRGEDVCRLYEQNMGRVTPVIYEEISVWVTRFDEEIVMEAVRRAVKYGGRTFRYVEQILIEWASRGVETVDDVLIEDAKLKASHDRGSGLMMEKASQGTGKSVFDLVREEVGV